MPGALDRHGHHSTPGLSQMPDEFCLHHFPAGKYLPLGTCFMKQVCWEEPMV
jgi:hypothetical protein